MPIRFGTVVAVERDHAQGSIAPDSDGTDWDGSDDIDWDGVDWEVVADGVADYEGGMQRHRVEALCITGADADGHLVLGELSGDAVVVRYVERTVVLRGDGPLIGLTREMLQA